MKWVALALFLLAAPAVALWLRTNPRRAPLVWGLLGFLPFVTGPWHLIVSPFATPMWSGYVKGWDITLLDAVAFGIVLGSRGRWPRLTLLIPFLMYIFAVLLSMYQAKFGNLAASYLIQVMRVFLVYLAVARIAGTERGERAVLTGVILGLTVQAGYAIFERATGALQTGGSLGHQNLLGFVSHMAIMPALALFLAGRWPRLALLGIVAGTTVVILTASRATIAFSAVGIILTLILTMMLRFTSRKATLGLIIVVMLLASFPLANAALERRFEAQRTTFFAQDEERDAFERAARAMIATNPMGVGPNHYVFIANTEEYSARAGVSWTTSSRSTSVHNSYLLIAAETGYLGLITFIVLIACAIWYAFRTSIRYRREPAAEVLIGIGCGIIAMSLHGFFEWMFVMYPVQYIFAVGLGLIVGIRARLIATGNRRGLVSSRRRRTSLSLAAPSPA